MTTMGFTKKLCSGLVLAFAAVIASAQANTGGPAWDKAPNRIQDMGSLQNGAKVFVNYCLNCHSAAFMRYPSAGYRADSGANQKQFAVDQCKNRRHHEGCNRPHVLKAWFGNTPPDLTVIARSRAGANGTGADYLYTYMRTFYRDETKPTGWNNLVFPNAAMPHALWELQGDRRAVFEEVTVHGQKTHEFKGWEQLTPGTLSPAQYDQTVGDLVNYLQWMGEPGQTSRQRLGVWVLAFLAVFTFITWRLNKAFWKDVK